MPLEVTRRTLLSFVGGAVAMVAGQAPAAPAIVPIRVIRVTGERAVTLQNLAPLVAEQLASILGPRYAPGARGGATLLVQLTQVLLDDGDGGTGSLRLPFGHDTGTDQLEGQVMLVGPRREAFATFPLLVNSGAIYRSSLRMFPDPRRLNALARAFAWWTVSKLG
jgi:hypothetical protein